MKKSIVTGIALMTLCSGLIFTGCGKSTTDSNSNTGNNNNTGSNSDSAGSNVENTDEFYFEGVGFSFNLPESVKLSNGFVGVTDAGDVDYDSGVMMGWPSYIDMPEDEYYDLPDSPDVMPHVGNTFSIICVQDVDSEAAALEKSIAVVQKTNPDFNDEIKEDLMSYHMIHQENGYVWLSKTEDRSTDINDNCKAEYDAFYDATDDIISNMNFFTPTVWKGSDEGTAISFKTTDIDGNEVDSATLFAQNKVTMINIWATTCGPCINEMPELEELNKEFQQKGGAIIGIIDDVTTDNTTFLEDAKDIVKDTGVTYTNLRAWDGYYDQLPSVGTPTTYFVDSNGKIIGNPVLGAQLKVYAEKMDEYLSQAK